MNTIQVSVVFYRGMAPVRLWLHSHYGHVGFRYGDTLVEATSDGVCARPFGSHESDRFARQIAISLPSADQAASYAAEQVGKPYDWGAIRQDFIAPILRYKRFEDKQEDSWDCSRLVQSILLHGGYPDFVTNWPITPQCIFLALTKDHPYGFPQLRLPDFTDPSVKL